MPVLARPHRLSRAKPTAWHLDDRTLRWMARTDHGPLRPVLRTTARASDVLMPHAAVSLWVMAEGNPDERAAILRGWAAMIVASLIQDTVKPMIGRGRPDAQRLPPEQRRKRSPSSSAFPSGHVAATTAFAIATGRDAPRFRSWFAVSTVVIAYSRVYTGRHYLSDVLVGTAIGAVADRLSRRLPLRPVRT